METFSNIDLKKWRESLNKSAADVAAHCSLDISTYYKYESGKMSPNPDVMYQICDYLGDLNVWCVWMRTEYPKSYARVHPKVSTINFPGAILSFFSEWEDVKALQNDIMRDGADGIIDDPHLLHRIDKELSEFLGKAQVFQNFITMMKHGR